MELRCLLCGENVHIRRACTCPLGEHLLEKHPEVQLGYYCTREKQEKQEEKSERGPVKEADDDCKCCDCCECETTKSQLKNVFEKMNLLKKPVVVKSPKKEPQMFKTTVETWKQGPVNIKCPFCGEEGRPCMRKQRNRVASSPLGAFFMLSCWPLCFLPFLMPEASNIDLFCKNCGSFLGEYNRQTGRLKCPCISGEKKLTVPCVNADADSDA